MKNSITYLSTSKAALTVGLAFISSLILVTLVDDFILANFVVPGDTAALGRDIAANDRLFDLAVIGYLLVLVLDMVIGLTLYVVLKPANKPIASLIAVLRLLYAFTLIIGVMALALKIIDVYGYTTIKLLGYIFFAFHIFILGYAIIKSGYIPKSLGILLVVAAFTYIVFFVDFELAAPFELIIMLLMALAELLLSIWLMAKRKTLPKN